MILIVTNLNIHHYHTSRSRDYSVLWRLPIPSLQISLSVYKSAGSYLTRVFSSIASPQFLFGLLLLLRPSEIHIETYFVTSVVSLLTSSEHGHSRVTLWFWYHPQTSRQGWCGFIFVEKPSHLREGYSGNKPWYSRIGVGTSANSSILSKNIHCWNI